MCSLFLVLRLLITIAVRSIKKKTHQRLLSWEVSVMQQRLIFEELQAAGPEHEKTAWAEAPQAVCAGWLWAVLS